MLRRRHIIRGLFVAVTVLLGCGCRKPLAERPCIEENPDLGLQCKTLERAMVGGRARLMEHVSDFNAAPDYPQLRHNARMLARELDDASVSDCTLRKIRNDYSYWLRGYVGDVTHNSDNELLAPGWSLAEDSQRHMWRMTDLEKLIIREFEARCQPQ